MIILIFGKKGTGKTTLAKKIASEYKNNLIIFDTNNEYFDLQNHLVDSFDKLHYLVKRKIFPIRFYNVDYEKFFFYLNFIKGFTLLVDELHLYTYHIPKKDDYLNNLIRLSRHKKLNIIGITQRISEVSRTITSQADKIITFRQTETIDLEKLEKLGFDSEQVKNLKNFEFLELKT